MPAINERVVLGWADLDQKLQQLVPKVRYKAMRRGLYAGAALIRDEARRRVHVRLGFLKRQIRAYAGSPKAKQDLTASVYIARGRFINVPSIRTLKSGAQVYRTKWHRTTATLSSIKGRYVNPRRYAHLLEFGTSHSRAFAFLFAAANAKRAQAQAVIAAKIREDMGW